MPPSPEITPERILEIEYNQKSLAEHLVELKTSVDDERAENKVFQTTILQKLDSKPNFNLPDTLKTVLVTIGIVGAITAGIDYRIQSNISPVKEHLKHTDNAVKLSKEKAEKALDNDARYAIVLSGHKDEIERNSNFIDDFVHVKQYPIIVNSIQKDLDMIRYQINKRK